MRKKKNQCRTNTGMVSPQMAKCRNDRLHVGDVKRFDRQVGLRNTADMSFVSSRMPPAVIGFHETKDALIEPVLEAVTILSFKEGFLVEKQND
mmetsp:Transcript_8434/g.14495  ORF Transcript_8434/g.14495 Transcript_8434/m.14495 type:complete len:93 (-) Transcript_8434:926-1204(-)